jgi:hypothetical protein
MLLHVAMPERHFPFVGASAGLYMHAPDAAAPRSAQKAYHLQKLTYVCVLLMLLLALLCLVLRL